MNPAPHLTAAILGILSLALSSARLHANPEIAEAVAQTFGRAVADNILLLKGTAVADDPANWMAYGRDAFRPGDQVRIAAKREGRDWTVAAAGTGKVLDPAPPRVIDFGRIRQRSSDARAVAAKAAVLAKASFTRVDYQLAANASTGAPEWGLALMDDTGYEVGFCVVSAETGALSFQDWTPRPAGESKGGLFGGLRRTPESEGERAARAVKRAGRRAWEWTDEARKETGSFFRELFR